MASLQRLNNVCNGGHLHYLSDIRTEGDLKRAMNGETKAIAIVDDLYCPSLVVLRKMAKRKKGFRAMRVRRWSSTASLWFIFGLREF